MNQALFHGSLVTSSRILYTPSDFAKGSLIHLQEIGQLQAQKPHISKRENLASFLFFTVLSGSGKLVYQGKVYYLTQGDCVFIDCKKPYSHESSNDLWSLKWVHFFGPNVSGIYEKYKERGGENVFHPIDTSSFIQIIDSLYQIADSEDYIRDMRINEGLTTLLTHLMAESLRPDQIHTDRKLQSLMEIKNYLDENYTQRISLDELSERFYINKFYLTRIFKEQFGVSIYTYLFQIRITHAKQLLRFTDKTVAEIGEECGMGALYYFSRMFKKVEGISPSEYRKQWEN